MKTEEKLDEWMSKQTIHKRSEIEIPMCQECGGRMDPNVLVPAPAPEPGQRGILLACFYGTKCRDCGFFIRD